MRQLFIITLALLMFSCSPTEPNTSYKIYGKARLGPEYGVNAFKPISETNLYIRDCNNILQFCVTDDQGNWAFKVMPNTYVILYTRLSQYKFGFDSLIIQVLDRDQNFDYLLIAHGEK